MLVVRVCLFCLLASASNAAKILGIFPMAAYSHYIQGSRLMRALAEKGHEVTIITPFLEDNPPKNYREVYLSGVADQAKEVFKGNAFKTLSMNPFMTAYFLTNHMGPKLSLIAFNHPAVQNLLNDPTEQFEVVIIQYFLNDFFLGISHHFKASTVLITSISTGPYINNIAGNEAPVSYIPDPLLNFQPPLSFWQRMFNLIFKIFEDLNYHLIYYPKINALLKQYFPESPSVYELHKNVSLALLNSHVSISPPIPQTPNMIQIGGYHVQPPKELPKDLQMYLDNATEGVVYFSMGSNLKSKDFSLEKREAILRAFSKLEQKVLWKFEDEDLAGRPDNVKIGKWLPQQDILAHSNIRAFITHGGLLSTIETIYHGVPVIAIPIVGDQISNTAKAVASGYAIKVDFDEISEDTLTAALHEILNNPRYRENAKRRSAIMRDRPIEPIENAIYWVEYVIRHKGAHHLKVAALDLTWIEYYMLDVIAFLSTVAFVAYYFTVKLAKRLFRKKTISKKVKRN